MKLLYTNNIIPVLLLLAAVSCVPQKHYQDLLTRSNECAKEKEKLYNENEKLKVENTELKSRLEVSEENLSRIKGSGEGSIKDYATLKEEYNTMKRRYDELSMNYEAALKGSDSETRNLLSKLNESQKNLTRREEQLEKDKAELQVLRKELDERNKKLVELEKILAAKDAQVDAIKQKVSDALMGFEGEGLSVTKKNGRVYVSLEEKLLFPSGSTEVNERGKAALIKLGSVLSANYDIQVTIEGHTDDVPVKPGSAFKDNWDLSVQRATAIIRILLDNSSINPKRLTASGRGPYLPVDTGKSAEARQKNRRTEIILTPDLDEIFSIIDSN